MVARTTSTMEDLRERLHSVKAPLVLWSGGLDSTILCWVLSHLFDKRLTTLYIDIGQGNREQEERAISVLRQVVAADTMLRASCCLGDYRARVDPQVVKDYGHIGRNAIMVTIAVPHAFVTKSDAVLLASTRSDGYSDASPGFRRCMTHVVNSLFPAGIKNETPWFDAPFVALGLKKDAVARLIADGTPAIPIQETWSCWGRGPKQCGICEACNSRREALRLAGLVDPTEYAAS